MERVFLSWDAPLVPVAAAWLCGDPPAGGTVDLRGTVCVTPGRRAGRALLGHLIRTCEARRVELIPPRTVAPAALPEAVLTIDEAVASEVELRWAWLAALRDLADRAPDDLTKLMAEPPAPDDLSGWTRLAATFAAVDGSLAAGGRTSDDAAEQAENFDLLGERDRWTVLAELSRAAVAQLVACGLTTRTSAIDRALERDAFAVERIVLVGVPEIPGQARRVLEAAGERVVVIVHAPGSHADWFDALGCPDVERWADAAPALRDEQVVFADGPDDQAQAALDALAAVADGEGSSTGRAPDEITIGLGSPDLTGAVEHAATLAGLDLHVAAGRPLAHTAPAQLLGAVADWLDAPRLAAWAALVRHPDLAAALSPVEVERRGADGVETIQVEPDAWPARLDAYTAEHLDDHPGERWFDAPALPDLAADVRALLAPLTGRRRAPHAWIPAVLAFLRAVYGAAPPDDVAGRACLALRDALAAHGLVDGRLSQPVTAGEAIRLFLAEAAAQSLAEPVRAHQVEALGWHELHHDPAPVLVIVGMNDGAVPEAVRGDPFLPDGLRRALDLSHNEQRLARDTYVLTALAHACEHLRLIVGRTNALGDPLLPSRLVLGGDDATLRARIRGFCPEEPAAPRAPRGAPATAARSGFVVPPLPELKPPPRMRVTSFKSYLACPYRFALEHVMELKSATDDVRELDGGAFGSLAHDVLEDFGRDEDVRDWADAGKIEAFLLDRLSRRVLARFGRTPRTAVRLQIERLTHRLRRFAVEQAALRRDGWCLVLAETKLGAQAVIQPEGRPAMRITGKIDRVDVREHDGAFRIYDYKTGDKGDPPYVTHHDAKKLPDVGAITWFDLQLPLYRHFAPTLDVGIDAGADVELAYFALPRDVQATGPQVAAWTDEHIADAVTRAEEIVAAVHDGAYERNESYAKWWDPYLRICQTRAQADDAGGDE